jgi:hypothetical protein
VLFLSRRTSNRVSTTRTLHLQLRLICSLHHVAMGPRHDPTTKWTSENMATWKLSSGSSREFKSMISIALWRSVFLYQGRFYEKFNCRPMSWIWMLSLIRGDNGLVECRRRIRGCLLPPGAYERECERSRGTKVHSNGYD